MSANLSDALVGRYIVERELGQGGMATVYLARDVKHGRDVALKVLKSDLAQTLGAERFLREIQLAARLSHPEIPPLFDSGDAGGVLFYVMPRAAGTSLRDRLDEAKQLPVDEAVRIASEVAGKTFTQVGIGVGTPASMSPGQAVGAPGAQRPAEHLQDGEDCHGKGQEHLRKAA